MAERVLMKGNEAIAEAAIRAGCRHYFGYPITPQTEIAAYMAKRMPKIGGVFLQAESEIASINMVYGAAAAGMRVMTSSSSPGISLMGEGLSAVDAAKSIKFKFGISSNYFMEIAKFRAARMLWAEIVKNYAGFLPGLGSGSTDCNIPLSMDIPAICPGVVSGGGAHTREEYILRSSLLPGLKVGIALIASFMK